MKRKITLSIALFLSLVLVGMMSSDSPVGAQPPQRFRAATGVITPATGQTLRVTVRRGFRVDDGSVRFIWTQYNMAASCGGMPPVCRHTVASQGATPPMPLGDDALSFDVPGNGNGVNVVVESNSRNALVNALIIDTVTGTTSLLETMEEGECGL